MVSKITIPISKELKQKLKEKIKKTNFKSIEDYVLYFLKQLVLENEGETNLSDSSTYTNEEEENLKKKLKELGYL